MLFIIEIGARGSVVRAPPPDVRCKFILGVGLDINCCKIISGREARYKKAVVECNLIV